MCLKLLLAYLLPSSIIKAFSGNKCRSNVHGDGRKQRAEALRQQAPSTRFDAHTARTHICIHAHTCTYCIWYTLAVVYAGALIINSIISSCVHKAMTVTQPTACICMRKQKPALCRQSGYQFAQVLILWQCSWRR